MPNERILANVMVDAATRQVWDVAVVGAGPAGAIAARQAARAGARVVLVDRAAFPRHKVCGCCLNGAALGVLEQVGLGELPEQLAAHQLREFRLASGGHFASVPLAEGVSLSRERLDATLIEAAMEAGVAFIDETQALIGPADSESRSVELRSDTGRGVARARTIIVAGGLGCRVFARQHNDRRRASNTSRVGAGAVLEQAPGDFACGTIYMACHRHGYVGLVRLEDDRLDIAAALDKTAIKKWGSIGALVKEILVASGFVVPEMTARATWHGTGRLTQRRTQVAGDRYFVVGDAAGYVEPFTGEGMAWALATGTAVVPFALDSLRGNASAARLGWGKKQRELIGRRARLCRAISTLLRYPTMVSVAIRLLAHAPVLARPVVKSLNASFAAE